MDSITELDTTKTQEVEGRKKRQVRIKAENAIQDIRRHFEESDNRKNQIRYVTALLFSLSIAIMALSIISSDDFGNESQKTFKFSNYNVQRNINAQIDDQLLYDDKNIDQIPQFNQNGFRVLSQCPIKRYFTEGLEILDENQNYLILSSGIYEQSSLILMQFDIQKCIFNQIINVPLESQYFAEGITRLNNTVYQLTYKENQLIQWNLKMGENGEFNMLKNGSLNILQKLGLKEGWGLTHKQSNNYLYASDGTNIIFEIDPFSWTTLRKIQVRDKQNQILFNINELEIIQQYDDFIFANQFLKNQIYMINLKTGLIVKNWDLVELVNQQKQKIEQKQERSYDWANAVLNGIAYMKNRDSFLVSGKLWDNIYEIQLDYKDFIR